MSALSPAQVTGLDPATLKQLGSSEVGAPSDCMTWHRVPQKILWRADRGAGGTFEHAERSQAQVSLERVHQGPATAERRRRTHGAGEQIQSALLVCFCSVLLVRAHGPAFCLGVCLLGFPATIMRCYTYSHHCASLQYEKGMNAPLFSGAFALLFLNWL